MQVFQAPCLASALLALGAFDHTGGVMTDAEAASQTRNFDFPWKGTDDEVAANIPSVPCASRC